MNIILYIVLLSLVFILFIAAEYLDVVLHVAAFGILFILGVIMLTGNVEVKTGEQLSQNFTYAASPFNTSINSTSTLRTEVYTPFNTGYYRTIGIMICFLSVLGFVLVYVHYAKKKKDGEDW